MKTLVISTFPACGKTYLSKYQNNIGYHIIDIDSGKFKNNKHWETCYVDYIENKIGYYDFILISQHDEVLLELKMRNIPFITVAPDNSLELSEKEKQLIKQQWFGRFLLRDNSHINNIDIWLTKLVKNYDIWTNPAYLKRYNPLSHFVLKENQYLEDIINKIYLFKENFEQELFN
ncbi:MAG: hypothetical protein HDR34_00025 [Treponema sp.]|nr:hypothetical protein [Treponema sp.]